MDKNIADLLEQIDEGINNLKGRTNFDILLHKERLEEIKANLKNYKKRDNPDYLHGAITIFHETAIGSIEGANAYDTTIWDANIEVRGKVTTLDDLFTKLEELYRNRIQGEI